MSFISSSEAKMHFTWVAKPRMKYTFLTLQDEINGVFIQKNWIYFLLYTILSVADILH